MSRTRTAVLIALPLTAAAVALTLWAGPYWVDAARQVVAEQRWPAQRAAIEEAAAAVRLPDVYEPVPCPTPDLGGIQRCWRVATTAAEALPDLEAALEAVGVADLLSSVQRLDGVGAVGAHAFGVVEGRAVQLMADRELRDPAERPDGTDRSQWFSEGLFVRLLADTTAP